MCGRNFAEDRIEKHEEVCAKTHNKKRKAFDMTKARVKGTDAAKYVIKGKQNTQSKERIIFLYKFIKYVILGIYLIYPMRYKKTLMLLSFDVNKKIFLII